MEIKEVTEEVKQQEVSSADDVGNEMNYCCCSDEYKLNIPVARVNSLCKILIRFVNKDKHYHQQKMVVYDIVGIEDKHKEYYFYPDALDYLLNKGFEFERITRIVYLGKVSEKANNEIC